MTAAIKPSADGNSLAFQVGGIDSAYITQSGIGSSIIPITASVAGNALTISLPSVPLDFRKGILTDGTVVKQVVGNLSITVPQGATLGTVNGVAARLAVLVARNSGNPVLCVVNMAGGLNLDETNGISPTTISASATSSSVIYSASSVTAGSAYRVVGFVDITQATAGTWASAPTLVQGVGGQALASMGSLGYGQTWQDVTVSRTSGTTYYNTTGKPIQLVVIGLSGSAAQIDITATVNSTTVGVFRNAGVTGVNSRLATYVTVPVGGSYSMTIVGTGSSLFSWTELR